MTILKIPIANLDKNGHQIGSWLEQSGEPATFVTSETHLKYPGMEEFPPYAVNLGSSCGTCGKHLQFERTGDDAVRIIGDTCKFVDGVTTVTEIDILSGRMIIDDDLRPHYDADMDDLNYNSAAGQAEYVKRMAAVGCGYGPVGNSCPSVFRRPDGSYAIANLEYDEETDEPVLPEGWVSVASICTDLWAYSIADADDYVSKGGVLDDIWTKTVVETEPGRYRFTYHGGEKDFDWDYGPGMTLYAEFERIEASA
jgi:hypothetical protein